MKNRFGSVRFDSTITFSSFSNLWFYYWSIFVFAFFSANHAIRIVSQANAVPTVLITAATIRTARIATRSVLTTSATSQNASGATTIRTARTAERSVTYSNRSARSPRATIAPTTRTAKRATRFATCPKGNARSPVAPTRAGMTTSASLVVRYA